MKSFPIYALFLFIMLCWSCSKNDATPAASALEFFPLEVGASWVYQTTTDNFNGPQRIDLDTITVLTSTRDGDDLVFTLSAATNFFLRVYFPTTLRLRDGKLYEQFPADTILFLTIDPADAGELVRTTVLTADSGVIEYRYDEQLELVVTPAGAFDCVNMRGQILATDSTATTHEYIINNYFSQGVGLVNTNHYFWFGGQHIDVRLLEYNLP
ncbi:MAG: hypothetical protein AAFO03_11080 [Bacteroidota bacterium]